MLLLLFACTGAGKGDDTATECPVGSHADAGRCASEITSWVEGPSLLKARDHHVTFVAESDAGPALYVIGGTNSRAVPNTRVERAWIGGDGSLGDWEALADFEEAAVGAGFAQDGRDFVLVGGLDALSNSISDTWIGRVEDDGSITLTAGEPLAVPRYHVTATLVDGEVFAIGGLYQLVTTEVEQEVMDTVERSSFAGVWETLDPLPNPSTHHGAFAFEGGIVLVGGGQGMSARPTVQRAPVEDGLLGEWTDLGDLPEAVASPAVTMVGDDLHVIGGATSLMSGEVATAVRGAMSVESAGPFEAEASLPQARAHSHQAPVWGDRIYSTGGSIDHEDQDAVYVGTLE